VAMAHALEDGRSILLIRSTREEGRKDRSNVLARYGNTTIPRHLRDIVVTEYGIADVRGQTDEQVALALIRVTDSRFQDGLHREAQREGKVARNHQLPDSWRRNRPALLEAVLAPYRARGFLPQFPFGTDLTPDEIVLVKALQHLKKIVTQKRLLPSRGRALRAMAGPPESARRYLQRMALDEPRTIKERLLQRALVYALGAVDAI